MRLGIGLRQQYNSIDKVKYAKRSMSERYSRAADVGTSVLSEGAVIADFASGVMSWRPGKGRLASDDFHPHGLPLVGASK